MKKYTVKDLEELGYKVEKALITDAAIMKDEECIYFMLNLRGAAWEEIMRLPICIYNDKIPELFGIEKGVENIVEIMNICRVPYFDNIKGCYIRVAAKDNVKIKLIGNIISDEWIDPFFLQHRELHKDFWSRKWTKIKNIIKNN